MSLDQGDSADWKAGLQAGGRCRVTMGLTTCGSDPPRSTAPPQLPQLWPFLDKLTGPGAGPKGTTSRGPKDRNKSITPPGHLHNGKPEDPRHQLRTHNATTSLVLTGTIKRSKHLRASPHARQQKQPGEKRNRAISPFPALTTACMKQRQHIKKKKAETKETNDFQKF